MASESSPPSAASVPPPLAAGAAARPGSRRLPMLLRCCWYNLNQTFRRRIADLGVTPDQFTALRSLVEAEPEGLTQSRLTKVMNSDPNTIASLVERMEAIGWIERRPHATDRRAKCIRLLPPGRAKHEAARSIALVLQTEILSVLPDAKREEFLDHLEQVGAACQRVAERVPAVAAD